jgi:hypothetical protein
MKTLSVQIIKSVIFRLLVFSSLLIGAKPVSTDAIGVTINHRTYEFFTNLKPDFTDKIVRDSPPGMKSIKEI